MSGWYYIKPGLFKSSEAGPLADEKLSQLAFDAKVDLKTRVRHPAHTRNTWVFLEQIPAFKKSIEDGAAIRDQQALEKKNITEATVYNPNMEPVTTAQQIAEFKCPFCGTRMPPTQIEKRSGKQIAASAVATAIYWPVGLMSLAFHKKRIRMTCSQCGKALN